MEPGDVEPGIGLALMKNADLNRSFHERGWDVARSTTWLQGLLDFLWLDEGRIRDRPER